MSESWVHASWRISLQACVVAFMDEKSARLPVFLTGGEGLRLVEIHLVSRTVTCMGVVTVFEDGTGYLGRLRRLSESVQSKFLGLGPVVFNVYAIKAAETSRTRNCF